MDVQLGRVEALALSRSDRRLIQWIPVACPSADGLIDLIGYSSRILIAMKPAVTKVWTEQTGAGQGNPSAVGQAQDG